MTKILVSGGAGFIGSHLVDRLLNIGYGVIVIDNLSSGLLMNLNNHLINPRFELICRDIREKKFVYEAVGRADVIIHLAAIVSVISSFTEPNLVYDVNVNGTINLLEASVKHKIRRFIYASSAAVYGRCSNIPHSEDNTMQPISPYGASKAAGEFCCKAYHHSYELETVILRFMNVYGPGKSVSPYSDVMVNFAESIIKRCPLIIYGDGEQTRDFLHVSGAVEAIILALDNEKASGEIFNIGTGRPTTINQLSNLFIEMGGYQNRVRHVDARKGEIRDSYTDVSKANNVLKFQHNVELAEGVSKFMKWYKQEKSMKDQ